MQEPQDVGQAVAVGAREGVCDGTYHDHEGNFPAGLSEESHRPTDDQHDDDVVTPVDGTERNVAVECACDDQAAHDVPTFGCCDLTIWPIQLSTAYSQNDGEADDYQDPDPPTAVAAVMMGRCRGLRGLGACGVGRSVRSRVAGRLHDDARSVECYLHAVSLAV